jgi:uncharacterized protein YbjQ (UPF0145 family)
MSDFVVQGREISIRRSSARITRSLRASFDKHFIHSHMGVSMDHSLVTTNISLEGYRVVRNLGVVRGIVVRSRSLIGNIGAGIQILFGGNISLFTELCEQTRREAYELMIQHAQELGSNAILAFRYDATEIAGGVTEVLAYGTAVVVEKTA